MRPISGVQAMIGLDILTKRELGRYPYPHGPQSQTVFSRLSVTLWNLPNKPLCSIAFSGLPAGSRSLFQNAAQSLPCWQESAQNRSFSEVEGTRMGESPGLSLPVVYRDGRWQKEGGSLRAVNYSKKSCALLLPFFFFGTRQFSAMSRTWWQLPKTNNTRV